MWKHGTYIPVCTIHNAISYTGHKTKWGRVSRKIAVILVIPWPMTHLCSEEVTVLRVRAKALPILLLSPRDCSDEAAALVESVINPDPAVARFKASSFQLCYFDPLCGD